MPSLETELRADLEQIGGVVDAVIDLEKVVPVRGGKTIPLYLMVLRLDHEIWAEPVIDSKTDVLVLVQTGKFGTVIEALHFSVDRKRKTGARLWWLKHGQKSEICIKLRIFPVGWSRW